MARKTPVDQKNLRDGTNGLQSRSPLRQQYENIKAKFPDGILLFRLGDFYETFDDDAVLLSRDLDITLTSKELGKADRVPLAGIPVSTLNSSISKLLDKGHKVAICEQMESDTKPGTLINREIVRIVTPGTILEEDLLPGRSNNFLVSLVEQANRVGLAYIDIS
ncbi:MAG: DNA mismatch repair protein MutS, partial [Chloroflexota bacterium]|nr:DNA mismatch repair protein MutS [Chloroflexota bacterium]